MKRFWLAIVSGCLGFCFVVVLSAPSFSQQKAPGQSRLRLTYVTNPAGTGLYAIAVGQGQVLSKKTNIDLVIQPASGALAVPRLVYAKEAALGITNSKILLDAYKGIEDYAGKKFLTMRILQAGQVTPFGIVTHTGTGIKTIADLKGKRVTWNILTSDLARKVAFYEMKAYGIDPYKDVKMLKSESTVTGLQDLAQGRTDAAACSLEGSKFDELATKVTPVVLPFDQSKIAIVKRDVPTVVPFTTRKTTSMAGGVPALGSPEAVFATTDLDDETAYRIVKALLESVDELKQIHRDFVYWGPGNAVQDLPVPYHPGAIKYYKEKGLWTPKMEQNQAQLLK